MKHFIYPLLLTLGSFLAIPLQAAMHTETVLYKQGETTLEGYLAYDDSITTSRPGVLVVHDWMGLDDYAKLRTRKIAELGYVAFAADIYGQGVRPKDAKEAGGLAGKYKGDLPLFRARVNAALDTLRTCKMVDTKKIAALGYCFGGTAVLELARSGADLDGVITFHGGLSTTLPAEPGKVKPKILVLHGADDPFSPLKEVVAFNDEMKKAGVDYQIHLFSGAVHAFTRYDADGTIPGAQYNKAADLRSWEIMKGFLNEIFQGK